MCAIGNMDTIDLDGSFGMRSCPNTTLELKLRWVTITPFGLPVEPEV